jgi:hypothetical protein
MLLETVKNIFDEQFATLNASIDQLKTSCDDHFKTLHEQLTKIVCNQKQIDQNISNKCNISDLDSNGVSVEIKVYMITITLIFNIKSIYI